MTKQSFCDSTIKRREISGNVQNVNEKAEYCARYTILKIKIVHLYKSYVKLLTMFTNCAKLFIPKGSRTLPLGNGVHRQDGSSRCPMCAIIVIFKTFSVFVTLGVFLHNCYLFRL